MSVKLVILDIEGVITDPRGGQHPLSLEDNARVRTLLEKAPLACSLCSGRQAPFGECIIVALNLFKPLPEEVQRHAEKVSGHRLLGWPSVLENGAYLWDSIAKRAIPNPVLTPDLTQTLQRLRSEVLIPLVADTKAQFEPGKDYCVSINPPLLKGGGGNRMETDTFGPIVKQALAEFNDAVEIKWSKSAIDITPRGISKAGAIALLLEWTGLKPEEVLGVGDTGGDKDWLQVVGHRAAPANGKEYLPGMGFYAPSDSAAGLVEILEHLKEQDYQGI